jgi:two-component system cell cycle sensor histidine kinase/response regulator CckA
MSGVCADARRHERGRPRHERATRAARRVIAADGTPAAQLERAERKGGRPTGGATLRAVLTGRPEGVLVLDRDGLVLHASDTLREQLGGAAGGGADHARRGVPAETLFAPPSRDLLREAVRRALTGLPDADSGVGEVFHLAAGAAPEVRVTAAPILDEAGAATGAVLFVRPEAEERIRAAQMARSQRWVQVGQLALSVTHDLANLLTGVTGAAEALDETLREAMRSRAVPGALGAQLGEDIVAIQASAVRGAALVRQLLSFGARETGMEHDVAVDAAIRDAAGLMDRLWRGRTLVSLDLRAGESRVKMDPTGFDQVLLNLGINARDAMLDGGRLMLRSRCRTLAEPMSTPGGMIVPGEYVVIEAEDSGIGILPEVIEHIFDPFFTTKRARGGTGLGLATVLGIVRQAGGTITVASEVGSGTCFRVYLPRRPGGAAKPDAAASGAGVTAVPAGLPRRGVVLLVEDEDVVRRMAGRTLTRRGWQVLSAASGEAALELIGAGRPVPSLLLTDMALPGVDGIAVIQAVRARLGRPTLPAILASGFARETLRPDVDGQGAHFLSKPYTPAELAACIDAALRPAAGREGDSA